MQSFCPVKYLFYLETLVELLMWQSGMQSAHASRLHDVDDVQEESTNYKSKRTVAFQCNKYVRFCQLTVKNNFCTSS